MQLHRRDFYQPIELEQETKKKISEIQKAGGRVDYLTFVSDGEPTLARNLGIEIELLKQCLLIQRGVLSTPLVRFSGFW